MTKTEVIEVLTEDLNMWARALGHFEKNTNWFNYICDKIQALRIAIESIEESEHE